MKVIICGAGQVGTGIAERLSTEGNSVSIIDASAELVQRANDMLEVRAVHGRRRRGEAARDDHVEVSFGLQLQLAHGHFLFLTAVLAVLGFVVLGFTDTGVPEVCASVCFASRASSRE